LNILLTAMHPVGGIRTYFRYVYSQDVFKDCSFTLIGRDPTIIEYIEEFLPKNRINVIYVKNWKEFIVQAYIQLQNNTYACVHSHGFTSAVLTYILTLIKNKKHIVTAHDVFTNRQFSGFKGKLKYLLLQFVLNKADYIHTVTQDAQDNLQDYFPKTPTSKLRLILHGIETDKFSKATPRHLKKELGIADKQALVGFFGRFMGQKGFRVLVSAIKLIKDERLLPVPPKVVTFGWGGFIREDYQYIDELGLSDYFIQMPNTDDMPAAIKGVDVVAMPSRWEACGLLGMEVLSSGTPLVGTNCIGLREVLANTPAVIIDVDDVNALAYGMISLLSDEAKESFAQYKNKAVERYSVENAALGMHSLYHELSSDKEF